MIGTWSPAQVRLALVVEHGASVVAAEDVRGFDARDSANRHIGSVDDLVIDVDSARVRFLKVGMGGLLGFGREHRLVPVDIVDAVSEGFVFLDTSAERIADAPAWVSHDDQAHIEQVCRYHGCQPYWSDGYRAPDWAESA